MKGYDECHDQVNSDMQGRIAICPYKTPAVFISFAMAFLWGVLGKVLPSASKATSDVLWSFDNLMNVL